MRWRNGVLAFALVGGLGLAGLAVSAARGQQWTAFSVKVAARGYAVIIQPGQEACQAPVVISARVGGVEVWAHPGTLPGPLLGVTVSDARDHKLLAVGRISPGYRETAPPQGYPTPDALRTRFDATVPAGKRIELCFLNVGPNPVGLLGSGPSGTSGTLTTPAQSPPQAISLLFLRPASQSLFSMLPTIFRRAMLFRPTWVGAWTFWLLLVALLGSFGVGALAIARASAADAEG